MRRVLSGNATLYLAGSLNYPNSLILSLINQFHLHTSCYAIDPASHIAWLGDRLITYLQSQSIQPTSSNQLLRAVSSCLHININIYSDNQHFYVAHSEQSPTFSLFHLHNSFDSVVNKSVSLLINDPLPNTNGLQYLKLATWNLRGCTNREEREMVVFCLKGTSLDLIAVQETHENAASLSTTNYSWFLGPQYQNRSSRGIGFLISHQLRPLMESVTFVTANIGYISLRLPFLPRVLHLITVHKLNNRDNGSIIETGNLF